VGEVFAEFDETPRAAASVAQVHAARLKPQGEGDPGMAVVVKVLRPDVEKLVERDIALLRTLADLAERLHPQGRRLRPRAVVAEYEKVIFDELDLMREGANCAQLRRNWLGSELIYHPLVFWDYTRPRVLVMERIYGISVRELDVLRQRGANFRVLAERGVEIFFKQVFRDNFFHADMHPGNIFVDLADPARPSYLAVDFGIVGTLTAGDQRYLAENFLAFFNRDYKRVAELHVESGWVPKGTRVEDFESAIRTVCEPIFGKPIKDISFGFFLVRLFQIARRFNYQVQPQLVLLQKTLLTVEGLGRQLYPELDLWKTAKPIMEQWMWNRLGPSAQFARLRSQAPMLAESLPELAQRALKNLAQGPLSGSTANAEATEALREELRDLGRRGLFGLAGAAAWVCAALLYGLSTHSPTSPMVTAACMALGTVGIWNWWRAFREPREAP
jgi:ubiquinone biosynthesis protein